MYKNGSRFFILTFVIYIVLIIGVLFLLQSCGTTSNTPDNIAPETTEAATELANFKVIEGKEYLAYDIDTKVVYYTLSNKQIVGYGIAYGNFTPYISENGRFCRYIDGEIVEICEDTSISIENTKS